VGDIPWLLNTCTKFSMHVRAPLSIFATQVHECKPIQLGRHPPRATNAPTAVGTVLLRACRTGYACGRPSTR
jgi:hypothetical protein